MCVHGFRPTSKVQGCSSVHWVVIHHWKRSRYLQPSPAGHWPDVFWDLLPKHSSIPHWTGSSEYGGGGRWPLILPSSPETTHVSISYRDQTVRIHSSSARVRCRSHSYLSASQPWLAGLLSTSTYNPLWLPSPPRALPLKSPVWRGEAAGGMRRRIEGKGLMKNPFDRLLQAKEG